MAVKMVRTRAPIGKLPGYSNAVYDGYIRYITVDGKRFADVFKFKAGHWQAYECNVNRRERRPRVWRGNTQRGILTLVTNTANSDNANRYSTEQQCYIVGAIVKCNSLIA